MAGIGSPSPSVISDGYPRPARARGASASVAEEGAMPARSTSDIVADHVRLRCAGNLETDLARNYAADAVVLCQFGIVRGREQIHEAAERIGLRLPRARFAFLASRVDGEVAFVEWAAEAGSTRFLDGADTFLVRDGLIRTQTISFVLVSYP